jgi:hypothetical protein
MKNHPSKPELTSSSKRNPLNLKIGDQIAIIGYSTIDYDSDGIRKLYNHPKHSIVFVCGIRKKATGKYEKGSSYATLDGYDYDQPSLAVDKYHNFYECRDSITGQPFLVHPSNILKKP